MNIILKSALAGLVTLVGFGSAPVFAQDTSCSCATAYHGPANPIGSIRSVSGNVMVSQTAGYGPAKAGSALDFGSRLVVGAKGSASVQVGDCRLSVPANSSLDISRVENSICLKVVNPEHAASSVSPEQTGAIDPSHKPAFGLPAQFFAGALLTAGVLAATQDNNNGVSH
ncbi:hypothetical protein EN828_28260 [Mesorhizobium sp. M2D.F.Ca.ET.185.01.1.1]|uniref:hypothetical protein n=1 Tax=unclassified Mesorhizobium TaxID=325217 RepID=UPI000FCA5E1E|nr:MULTISPECIES: hypothetical protein [unclassified Mesorhizobium]TGP74281.1 hypothetical protein EN870_27910 [bacterium M00.F.Ca.ET.227.01.1.1]TGT98060.1 hypothetical protein EN806_47810 [bacterium M00.F.Ca.ET.163.01.1.1]TGU33840.1 hypothetical protein EN799_23015 [bacterium M00.F.Ca.ET.156.01.1.1]TGU43407.1 hypothetical protein EN789_28335 [bacterium M00.F.Ca.ET.146.01.1.1]TGV72950.1 hypothetical protein EN792_062655 [Mesorhizobium sp. M00.F.Ca.ET.149.01.1.1]TGW09078.1 hypothetical protein 